MVIATGRFTTTRTTIVLNGDDNDDEDDDNDYGDDRVTMTNDDDADYGRRSKGVRMIYIHRPIFHAIG